jgi:hypothetical protein
MKVARTPSPYVHVIKVLLTTASCGMASPGTGVKYRTELKDRLEPPACRISRPQPKKKKMGGERKDNLNKADNATLERGGKLPIRPPHVSTQGDP